MKKITRDSESVMLNLFTVLKGNKTYTHYTKKARLLTGHLIIIISF